ncbi:hypothetical protein [Roseimicrobium sp. ORNL1]|uniref:hypothetical protein n=1 Tax=Roseimicrobium sp. ORNL1 TaxID=2711231 RepID=UPI0013E15AA6|nr:hypothetical protein [Roseimicrobium sp. ORNL1]QIF01709.1 hypothetical protein G5S37_09290 [Roseimicrobium sp. ORNL1]
MEKRSFLHEHTRHFHPEENFSGGPAAAEVTELSLKRRFAAIRAKCSSAAVEKTHLLT